MTDCLLIQWTDSGETLGRTGRPSRSSQARRCERAAQHQQVGQAVRQRAKVLGIAHALRLQPLQLVRDILDAAQQVAQRLACIRRASQSLQPRSRALAWKAMRRRASM
jgi:hypothetical protein